MAGWLASLLHKALSRYSLLAAFPTGALSFHQCSTLPLPLMAGFADLVIFKWVMLCLVHYSCPLALPPWTIRFGGLWPNAQRSCVQALLYSEFYPKMLCCTTPSDWLIIITQKYLPRK